MRARNSRPLSCRMTAWFRLARFPKSTRRKPVILGLIDLMASGYTESCHFEFELDGRRAFPNPTTSWKTTPQGMERLIAAGRVRWLKTVPRYVFYAGDYPVMEVTNQWIDTQGASGKIYAVQTATKILERCLLMTTDPGDLVFDPTCGSGTTAYVAEQWGRRWITCDTSRVATTLAKQRFMTANFNYYQLAHPEEGIGSGLNYKTVPHVTLGSIANNPNIKEGMTNEQIDAAIARQAPQETLYDRPRIDQGKARVAGPFTVEAVPVPTVKPLDAIEDATSQSDDVSVARSELDATPKPIGGTSLLKTGIRGKAGQRISFARLEPMPGTRWLHAEGETRPDASGRRWLSRVQARPIARNGSWRHSVPMMRRWSSGRWHSPSKRRRALSPSRKIIVFAAFQFDPEASKDIDETNWPGVTLLKAQMNADLLTDDLKKKRASNESFWLIGQPDVEAKRITEGDDKGKLRVSVRGFDYYNTRTGNVESGGSDKIAMWMLDPDYDGRSLFPRQVFFPMAGNKDGWAKLARNLKAEIDMDLIEAYRGTASLPFEVGGHNRIAVKIIDDRGIESLKVIEVD